MRIAFYVLLTLLAAGLAACATLIIAAFRPERGAEMVLMGLPLVALPVACPGAALFVLAKFAGDRLRKSEQQIAYAASACTVLPFLLLFVLG